MTLTTGWLAWCGVAYAEVPDHERVMETIGQLPLSLDTLELAVVDEDCGDAPERAASVAAAAARANAGDITIAVVDGELPTSEEILEWADAHGVDVVALVGDACTSADAGIAAAVLDMGAGTVADAWRWGAEREVTSRLEGALLLVEGEGLIAAHRSPSEAEAGSAPLATADVSATREWVWPAFMVFALAVVAVFGGLVYLGLRRDAS